jgi:TetR/AcrR family transcriptional regulator
VVAAAPTRRHNRQATCSAILNATGEIIVEKGLDGFTISEIARRADVNRALIYHYYQNRENLITHAIDRLMERYNIPETSLSGDAVARSARSYIEHPEIGRFVFQLLLSGRPLLRVGERLQEQIGHVQELMRQQFPEAGPEHDPSFSILILAASCFAWSFAREELAGIVGLSVEDADDRFVDAIKRISELGLQSLQEQIQQKAAAQAS